MASILSVALHAEKAVMWSEHEHCGGDPEEEDDGFDDEAEDGTRGGAGERVGGGEVVGDEEVEGEEEGKDGGYDCNFGRLSDFFW